jgi:peroxiredoxin
VVATQTPTCDFGWQARDFRLRGTDGLSYSLADVRGTRATLVMFLCNHCPYVRATITRIVADVSALQREGVGAIAIMPNDTETYPEDSFEHMKVFAHQHRFTFPYAIDDTQATARAYGAVCTPDFFGFNSALELQYRGRLDSAGRNPLPPDGRHELLEAMRQIANTGHGPHDQVPSIGCSIKWRDR